MTPTTFEWTESFIRKRMNEQLQYMTEVFKRSSLTIYQKQELLESALSQVRYLYEKSKSMGMNLQIEFLAGLAACVILPAIVDFHFGRDLIVSAQSNSYFKSLFSKISNQKSSIPNPKSAI